MSDSNAIVNDIKSEIMMIENQLKYLMNFIQQETSSSKPSIKIKLLQELQDIRIDLEAILN